MDGYDCSHFSMLFIFMRNAHLATRHSNNKKTTTQRFSLSFLTIQFNFEMMPFFPLNSIVLQIVLRERRRATKKLSVWYQIVSHYYKRDVVCASRNVCVCVKFSSLFLIIVCIALTYLSLSPSHFLFYACACHTVISNLMVNK